MDSSNHVPYPVGKNNEASTVPKERSVCTSIGKSPFLRDYLVRLKCYFDDSNDFNHAYAALQSTPVVYTIPSLDKAKHVQDVIIQHRCNVVCLVAPLGAKTVSQLSVVKLLFQAEPDAVVRSDNVTYHVEFLLHLHVTRCQKRQSRNTDDHLIASCLPIWYDCKNHVGFEMEYFPAGTLSDLSDSVDADERLRLLRDVAKGLEFLNSLHIIHFDVKCSNVCVGFRKDGKRMAKLIDFGSAKFVGQQLDRHCTQGDTPAYSPPEIFARTWEHGWKESTAAEPEPDWYPASPQSDSWRLGLVVFEVMSDKKKVLWKVAHERDMFFSSFVRANLMGTARTGGSRRRMNLVFPGVDVSRLPACANTLMANLLCLKPDDRLTFQEVVQEIEQHLGETAAQAADASVAAQNGTIASSDQANQSGSRRSRVLNFLSSCSCL
eukprot:scpid80136/ scgid27289/ Serine/threonine-protein kinase SBK1; SH3-binding kinase 1